MASIANGATKGASLYRCVVIDPARDGNSIEDHTVVFEQAPGEKQAQYVGKTAKINFDFNESPIAVQASHPQKSKAFAFAETKETTKRFDGYISDLEIEIHCKKRYVKTSRR